MTIEQKRDALCQFCNGDCQDCPLADKNISYGCLFPSDWWDMTDEDINRAYAMAFGGLEVPVVPTIKDSGERREFPTGAVRDIQEGKGRCDLLPLDVVSKVGDCWDAWHRDTLTAIHWFQISGDCDYLYNVIRHFVYHVWVDPQTLLLEVSKHFEEGCQKYGENNWQKGIPTHCYIDSAVRHYLKWLRGDKDEPHERAFVWNILCCIWTCIHKPELNDYCKVVSAV